MEHWYNLDTEHDNLSAYVTEIHVDFAAKRGAI